jgi:type I restriction enzyme, S subunit
MAVFAEISTAKIFGAIRLDAEFYQPKYQENEALVRGFSRTTTLGRIATTFVKGIFDINAEEYADEGVPFVRINNLKNCLIQDDNIAFITPERHAQESKTALKKYDIILSKTAYPAASLVQIEECNTSQDTIAVRTNQTKDFNAYLAVYLNTRFGLLQMQRLFQGNIQSHLSLDEARTITIPVPSEKFQRETHQRLKDSISRRELSKSLYTEAENRLLHELGLDELDLSHELAYERNFSEVAAAGRYDAQFFQPKYQTVIDALTKQGAVEAVGSWGKVLKGRSVSEYIEKGVPVVRSGDLTDIDNVEDFKHASPAEDPFFLKRGDVCISSIGFGSIGKVQVFDKEDHPYATVSEVTVIRQRRVNPYYLQIFLQSLAGQLQIERWITGATGQLHLYPRDVEKFIIPILPEARQLKFEEIANKARLVRQEAKQLLEDAKRRVEQMILGEETSHVA